MVERFPDEFVTWQHSTPLGVRVNEVFGMDERKGKTWLELARQIYCEQGEHTYRVIRHFPSGAPYLENYPGRISITHTTNFFAVASLPKTSDINLENFNVRTALGIDAEALDRKQVIKVRDKFLSAAEEEMVEEKDLILNVQAWTIKEALYKAALCPGIDFKNNLKILSLPPIASDPTKKDSVLGKAIIIFPEESGSAAMEMNLYSYESYGCCVSLALSPKAARYNK